MRPAFAIDTPVALSGLLLIAQAVLVWQVLRDQGSRRPVAWWTWGALAGGLALVLIGLPDVLAGVLPAVLPGVLPDELSDTQPGAALADGLDGRGLVVLAAPLLALLGLWGSLSFAGLARDQRQAGDRARGQAQAAAVRAAAAEQALAQLQTTLADCEAWSNDRERLLRVLTHEVREPMHRASALLQALRQAPFDSAAVAVERWVLRIEQADELLGEVHHGLDNVLQAAALLQRSEPLALQYTGLALLIDGSLQDLPTAQRARVQVQWRTAIAQVPMAPALVRLALRNLLRNAFSHGGPAVQVQLRIEERFSPHSVVISVVDNGKGLLGAALTAERALLAVPTPTATISALAPDDVREGLGLQIVRQVMALHGGRLALHNLRGAGLSAAMELPMQASTTAQLHGGPAPA